MKIATNMVAFSYAVLVKERPQDESHPPQPRRLFSAQSPRIISAAVPPLPRRGLIMAALFWKIE